VPGIVGLITSRPPGEAERELQRMLRALQHEPFYRIGTCVDESLGVYVGWAIREPSLFDDMPLRRERGSVWLAFSGEAFTDLDPADATYIIQAYEDDRRFPTQLNGRFHGLAVDRARRTALLFNDRYGMHRLYYHASRDTFYFAAEAKAILAVRQELRQLDLQSLGEVISCGCALENHSLFTGISVLPPGSAWRFCHRRLEQTHQYFEPKEWEEQSVLEPEPYYRQLRDAFRSSVSRCVRGRNRVALSLTGGLDTRMIMAWHRPPPGSLPCYTFGTTLRDSRDVIVARQVADACRQPHTVMPVGPEFTSRFARYAERTVYLTDGCADVSRSADLYVNEQARAIAPVRLTGNYGGELLRRVCAFKPVTPRAGLYRPELLPYVRRAQETYAGLRRAHPLTFAAFMQAPWHHYGLLALEESQLALRSPYLDNDVVRCAYRAPPAALASDDVSVRLIADGDVRLRHIQTDRGNAYQEFLFKAEYLWDRGMPRWVALFDKALAPLRLERLFLGRHKFCHFRSWYRGVLAGYVRDILLDRQSLARPYVNPAAVIRIVTDHLAGTANYTNEIHRLLSLELTQRLLIESTHGVLL
jgi:asparagine synthase (glutamine-hydrolysing)